MRIILNADDFGYSVDTVRATIDSRAQDPGISLGADFDHRAALTALLPWIKRTLLADAPLQGIGHRVVHGADTFRAPVAIDRAVRRRLGAISALAPLHMPACLAVVDAVQDYFPDTLNLACFDTAFHADQPALATRLALPDAYDRDGYRRYGFHGLSYESLMRELTARLSALPHRLVALHLGTGASACAILDGHSVATTMGYSAADGLVMGTRTGSLDPGVILGLMRDKGYGLAELEQLIYRDSGLLALSGETSDMRALLASPSPRAAFAVDAFCYSAARHVGSLAVALGGLDALAFTGGIGEHAGPVREKICAHLRWLGVAIDAIGNAAHAFAIGAASVPVYVVATNEERVIVRHFRVVLDKQVRQQSMP